MDRGMDFLKSQVSNAVMQHKTLLENLEAHESQAEDQRYRDLCSRHIPKMREHQRMLEEYQARIGAEAGAGKKVLGAVLGVGRDLADAARESDFLRLVGDIVTAPVTAAADHPFDAREDARLRAAGEIVVGALEREEIVELRVGAHRCSPFVRSAIAARNRSRPRRSRE